jgi:hypothetical protein
MVNCTFSSCSSLHEGELNSVTHISIVAARHHNILIHDENFLLLFEETQCYDVEQRQKKCVQQIQFKISATCRDELLDVIATPTN